MNFKKIQFLPVNFFCLILSLGISGCDSTSNAGSAKPNIIEGGTSSGGVPSIYPGLCEAYGATPIEFAIPSMPDPKFRPDGVCQFAFGSIEMSTLYSVLHSSPRITTQATNAFLNSIGGSSKVNDPALAESFCTTQAGTALEYASTTHPDNLISICSFADGSSIGMTTLYYGIDLSSDLYALLR